VTTRSRRTPPPLSNWSSFIAPRAGRPPIEELRRWHVVGLDSNVPDTPAEGEPTLVVASEVDAAVQPRNGSFFGQISKLLFLCGEEGRENR
jgi:hypothetical protein